MARVLATRGDAPGLVHVISAMESCQSYKLWLNKANGHLFLRPDTGKCLHYYFYFIDELLGLCYLRVPTWAPFTLQFYCNGHSALARWRRADLVARLHARPSAMMRQLRRLRVLGLIKKVTHTYRYYLTRLGRAAIAAACSLTRFSIVPAMAATH